MSSERYVCFIDGASHHTCNLGSAAWVIYSPSGQLVASGGACLGPASNNFFEYRVVIAFACALLALMSLMSASILLAHCISLHVCSHRR